LPLPLPTTDATQPEATTGGTVGLLLKPLAAAAAAPCSPSAGPLLLLLLVVMVVMVGLLRGGKAPKASAVLAVGVGKSVFIGGGAAALYWLG